MTPNQKKILLALTIAVALTRWWGLSASIWDWDEALFSSGVRSFDVTSHHPHPPGFPLFILFGKALNLLLHDEFRSLQVISFIGSVFLFPALFYLASELGFSFAVSILGALITVFAPNVWFFGGTAFSDVPSLTLAVAGAALLLRSRHRGSRTLIAGAVVLGISAGFRSQNLAIGFLPFLLAAWPRIRARKWGALVVAALIIAAIVVASYIGAGLASYSWDAYQVSLQQHRDYIVRTDSFRSPVRPSLYKLFDDFFIKPFRFKRVSYGIYLLALVSLIQAAITRRWPPLLLFGTFGPFALAAWLILDFISASRFSIGYLPLLAILGADGVAVLVGWVRIPPRWREAAAGAGGALIALALVVWAVPAITDVHRTKSPPARAVDWIRQNLSPANTTLYVANAMIPIAEYELPEYRIIRVQDERGIPLNAQEAQNAYLFAEGITMEPAGLNFYRSRHSRLWRIARPRYFEVSILTLARRSQFLEGWHESENEGLETWRWMGRRSVTILPPQAPPAELRLTFTLPLDAIPVPNITITLNGEQVARIRGTNWRNELGFIVKNSRADAPNQLVIETDQWVNPRGRGITDDARDLGLRLEDMSWGAPRLKREP